MTTFFVGNLSPEATDADLRTVFSPFGAIGSVKVARNRAGKARGYAIIEVEGEEAGTAVEALRGVRLKGQIMDVTIDQSPSGKRPPHRPAHRSGGGSRRRR